MTCTHDFSSVTKKSSINDFFRPVELRSRNQMKFHSIPLPYCRTIANFGNFSIDGAQFIASALRRNTSLTYLSLADNKLLDQGTAFIAAALQENHKLHFLYLDRNFITDASAEILAVALQDNRGVSELSLAQNNISPIIAMKLVNKRLKELELFGNPRIMETDLKIIEEQIQANNTPQILLHIKAIPDQKQEINVRIPERNNNNNAIAVPNSSGKFSDFRTSEWKTYLYMPSIDYTHGSRLRILKAAA